jgi:hypothetical protein
MEISNKGDIIRQDRVGQFRRPEDGKKPYAHVDNQKVKSKYDQKERSVYVSDEKAVNMKDKAGTFYPKIFDSDAGMKFNAQKLGKVSKEESAFPQYDENGKAQKVPEQGNSIDQLI